MDRRALLERLAAIAAATGFAGCTNLSGNDGSDIATGSRTATAAETGTETASEQPTTGQPTTTNGPPDIPRPGTPPMATTVRRTTTGGEPTDIPPPGTPPSATTTGTDDGPPDIPAPGTPPAPTGTATVPRLCSLSHEVVGPARTTPGDGRPLRYEDLSPAAKHVFRRALNGKVVSIPYDSADRPPEFSYSDEISRNTVSYRGETYTLLTYSGTGCPAITATE